MRTSSAAAPLFFVALLAACGGDAPAPAPDPAARDDAEVVPCAIGAGSEFAADCPVERIAIDGEDVLVVHHPGGGFRRFALASDGSGMTAFDGADEARRSLDGDYLLVEIGTDRYRFPARPLGRVLEDADDGS